jgi:hypothetical protein
VTNGMMKSGKKVQRFLKNIFWVKTKQKRLRRKKWNIWLVCLNYKVNLDFCLPFQSCLDVDRMKLLLLWASKKLNKSHLAPNRIKEKHTKLCLSVVISLKLRLSMSGVCKLRHQESCTVSLKSNVKLILNN